MNKNDLIASVADRTGMSKANAAASLISSREPSLKPPPRTAPALAAALAA
jgi:hypothetical protein